MSSSYEEIRAAAIDLLSERVSADLSNDQFQSFKANIATVLQSRRPSSQPANHGTYSSYNNNLSNADDGLADEVFWDLFRQGIIILGMNRNNPNFPFFRVSSFGKKLLAKEEPYFFHDVSSYESALRRFVPTIDDAILLYVKEAMQAYMSGCSLSATVMIGVATEGAFLKLLDTIEQNPEWNDVFKNTFEQKTMLKKLNKFLALAEQHLMKKLPSGIKENFESDFAGILNMIRNYRNESGHPSGRIISREECFVLLRLFIPCCKKIYDLLNFFAQRTS
ncbi:MAG TPA: hypothetical protein DCQ33_07330 [Nitrospira sp.]|nr:hypothetical protein [Nitrospira sp.]